MLLAQATCVRPGSVAREKEIRWENRADRGTDRVKRCVGYLEACRMFGQRELNNAFAPLDFLPELLIPRSGRRA